MHEFLAGARIRPNSAEPHVFIALLYAQEKRFADAAAELRAAGQINEEEANEQLTSAMQLPPKPENLREYIAMLESKATPRSSAP
jgi:hypothetical protein